MDVRLKSTSQIGGVISISIPETTDLNLKLLLEQMLQFENAKRPFAKTCLFHPYFTTVLSDDEQQVDCLICFEKFMQSSTVRCSSGHCVCRECFNGYLSASLSDEARLWKERKGEILCVNFMCKIPYSVSALLPCLDEQSFEGLIKKKEEIRELAVASVLQEAHQKDLHRLEKEGSTHFAVRQIQEDILNMKCPRCHLVFHAFDGCFALKCRSCGCAFCAWCLQDCGKDAHSHVAKCKFRTSADALYGTEAEFRECHRVRKIRLIKHYMKQFPLETKDLLLEKIKPFLVDLNYPF